MNKKQLDELSAWARQVTRGQRESVVFLSLWSDEMRDDPSSDPVPVFQMGYAMLLDKPIVIVAPHGSRIPENVQRAARTIEYYDSGDTAQLQPATLRALKAAGLEPRH